jgi:hypothetical protein
VILEQDKPSCLSPAESRDQDVERAVSVEVARFHVGDARPPVEGQRVVFQRAPATQQHDRALVVIGRQELTEIGHEEVASAVLVEIDHRDVRRVRQFGEGRHRRVTCVRPADGDETGSHVRRQELEPAVAIHIGEANVGDRRCRRGARRRQTARGEGHAIGRGPFGGRRQSIRRMRLEIAKRALEIRRQGNEARRGACRSRRLRPMVANGRHSRDFVPPGRARKHVGGAKA